MKKRGDSHTGPQGARRLSRPAARALGTLRRSVHAGRPMSLPNFMRLYRRQAAALELARRRDVRASSDVDVRHLRQLYDRVLARRR